MGIPSVIPRGRRYPTPYTLKSPTPTRNIARNRKMKISLLLIIVMNSTVFASTNPSLSALVEEIMAKTMKRLTSQIPSSGCLFRLEDLQTYSENVTEMETNLTAHDEKGLECEDVTLTISFKAGDVETVFEQRIKMIDIHQNRCDAVCLLKTTVEAVRDDLWLLVAVLGAVIVISLATLITLVHMCTNVRREKELIDFREKKLI